MSTPALTPDDIEHFIQYGFVAVRGGFTAESARPWTDRIFARLGYDPADRATWEKPRIHMPSHESVEVATFAPRVWEAMCQLCGGADRIRQPARWGDGFIVNLGTEEDQETWQPPSAQIPGWHKDGDFFRHFLDSPEQGLLTIVLWSDVVPTGGATFIAADSVGVVARYLAPHTEGVDPHSYPWKELIAQCHDFREATGQAGDVFLMHPYLLHASSQNAPRLPRYITNPPISLVEPMQFNRPNPADFSPVERAVLRGLSVERLDFVPTTPREHIVSAGSVMKEQMKAAEKARLAALTTG